MTRPDITDAYGDKVGDKKNTRKKTRAEEHAVRLRLKMESDANFARCRHRDIGKAHKLDLEDGFTVDEIKAGLGFHTKKRHVCALCRCRSTAGAGTSGWWYWPENNPKDFGNVGHFGVGPCWKHAPMKSRGNHAFRAKYRETIMNEIEGCRQAGLAPDPHGGFMVTLAQTAENAEIRNDIRTSLETTKTIMEEMVVKLKDDSFTETTKGGRVPASDTTKHKLQLDTLKLIASIAKTDFDVSKGDYAHKDMIIIMVKKFLTAVDLIYKPKGDESDWIKMCQAMKETVASMASADGSALFEERVL